MKIYFLSILSFLPFISSAQLDSLKGPVRSVKETVIVYSHGDVILHIDGFDFGQYEIDMQSALSELEKYYLFIRYPGNSYKNFDRNRLLVEESKDFNNSSIDVHYYSYDHLNNISQIETKSNAKKPRIKTITRYTYDYMDDSSSQLKIRFSYSPENALFNLTEYFYNDKGQLIQMMDNNDNNYSRVNLFSYDTAGRIKLKGWATIEKSMRLDEKSGVQIIRDSLGNLDFDEYKYDNAGRLIEKKVPLGDKSYRIVFEYDSVGNVKKKYFYYRHYDSLYSTKNYEYNPNSSLKKVTWTGRHQPDLINFAEYFYTNGEISSVVYRNGHRPRTIYFKYKTDKFGNWTEQKKYLDDILLYTRSRYIKYWR